MKRFAYEDNGCPCPDCERLYGDRYDPHYRARQRAINAAARAWARSMARTAEIIRDIINTDRERLVQEQE